MVQGVGLRLRGQCARIRLGYIEGPACELGLFFRMCISHSGYSVLRLYAGGGGGSFRKLYHRHLFQRRAVFIRSLSRFMLVWSDFGLLNVRHHYLEFCQKICEWD